MLCHGQVALFYCLSHYFQPHLAGLHLHEVLQMTLSAYGTKHQQQFGLAVCQRITFDMVAVVVVLNGEPPTEAALL